MTGDKKKRHRMELIGVVCVLVVLGVGMFYLKVRKDAEKTGGTASGSTQEQSGENTVTESVSGQSDDTSIGDNSESISEDEGTDSFSNTDSRVSGQEQDTTSTETPTPEPEKSLEEKLAGQYQAVSWAEVVGDKILVCQIDSIEVRDFSNNLVKEYTDLGRISREAAAFYSNGNVAYYASASESGSRSIWRLDLETGEKEEMMSLDNNSRFAGANESYLYYTVWGEDGLENTLKARRISDGSELELGSDMDEVTVRSDCVIAMGLRFDVSPVELKIYSPDGSSSVTVGEYVNSYVAEDDRIYYLDYGSDYGYIPADLKSCSLSGGGVQVLAEDLNALSFDMAGDHTIFYASASEGTDTSGAGYLFYNYQTGVTRKAADSGTYVQFLCSDGDKAYLERENQIVVYDRKAGQFLDDTYPEPESGYYVEGFVLNGAFWAVQQFSDNRVEVIPMGG